MAARLSDCNYFILLFYRYNILSYYLQILADYGYKKSILSLLTALDVW